MRISDWSSDVCSSDLSTANRQGRGAVLEGDEAQEVLDLLKSDATRAFDHYEAMLNEREDGTPVDPRRAGLARELARINLPLSVYTQWYWKVDLHNFMHFLALRADAHAQHEIRAYRSEEHTSELQSLMRISYAVFCLKKNANDGKANRAKIVTAH